MTRLLTLKNFTYGGLLLIAISLSAWSILIAKNMHPATKADPNEADAYMQDIAAMIYNQEGKPVLALSAPKMTHYPADDTTNMDTPHVTVYRQSPQPWIVDAQFGKAAHGIDQITFWNNVVISHPADTENPTTTMRTELLNVLPNKQLANTDKAVTFIQPDTTIHAVGMQANLDEGTIKLLSETKGEYVPS